MLLFGKVTEDEVLPAAVETVVTAAAFKAQSHAAFCRLKGKMHLRVVAQRLEMPNALDGLFYRFPVHYAAGIYANVHVKALFYERGEHLGLHLTHELNVYLAQLLVPAYAKLRILVLEQAQLLERRLRVCGLGQVHAV